jgi:hypothetical protein
MHFLCPRVPVLRAAIRSGLFWSLTATLTACVARTPRLTDGPLSAGAACASAGCIDSKVRTRLERFDLIFGTSGPLPTSTDSDSIRRFVRGRMSQDQFYDVLFPRLFRLLSFAIGSVEGVPFTLNHAGPDQGGFYFLKRRCSDNELVEVRPWWDLGQTVRICKDAYRPEVSARQSRGVTQYCEATGLAVESAACGCGKFLLNCARDEGQRKAITDAIKDEPIRTMQHVVQARQRFSTALTMTGSVRSDYGELFYARNDFFQSGSFKMDPPVGGRRPVMRPRNPAFAGGVLTTPYYRYMDPAPRLILALLWEDFLCMPLLSTAVRSVDIFHLSNANLRSVEQMQLASQTGCRDCHARLEYGMVAFRAFTIGRDGMRQTPQTAFAGPTRFYMRNAEDMRGEGPATPLWLGKTMAAQPEFGACMAQKVSEIFYGGRPVPEALADQMRQDFLRDEDLGALVENAFIAWVRGIDAVAPRGMPSERRPAAGSSDGAWR